MSWRLNGKMLGRLATAWSRKIPLHNSVGGKRYVPFGEAVVLDLQAVVRVGSMVARDQQTGISGFVRGASQVFISSTEHQLN